MKDQTFALVSQILLPLDYSQTSRLPLALNQPYLENHLRIQTSEIGNLDFLYSVHRLHINEITTLNVYYLLRLVAA